MRGWCVAFDPAEKQTFNRFFLSDQIVIWFVGEGLHLMCLTVAVSLGLMLTELYWWA